MKTTVFLVRHGAVDNPMDILYGRNMDLKLSDKGREEIISLAKKIKRLGFQIDKIYSSPLIRAVDSAKIFGGEFNVNNKIVDDLTDTDISATFGSPRYKRVLTYKPEYIKKGNESPHHIIERMKGVFWQLVNYNIGKTIVIVGHGDPLRFLLYTISHPGDKSLTLVSLQHSKYIYKGTAVKVIIKDGKLLEREFIKPQNYHSSSIINI